MKKMRKVAGMLMAATVAMAMPMSAMAASITVNGAFENETYKAYKIFDYTSSGDSYAYTMSADSAWKSVVEGYEYASGQKLFTLTPSANDAKVLVVTTTTTMTEVMAGDFAAYLSENSTGKSADETVTASKVNGEVVASFDSLGAGYYFVNTTTGSVCSLVNKDSSQTLREKNDLPSIVKKIVTTAEGVETLVDATTASIGDKVTYKIKVTDGKGTDKEIAVHDTMDAQLTLDAASIKVEQNGKAVDSSKYTISTSGLETGCTFEVKLSADFVKALDQNDEVEIIYDATLSADTVVGSEGNQNSAHITYSESYIPGNEVSVYAYKFGLVKTDTNNKVISGDKFAKFRLYEDAAKNKEIPVVKLTDGTYRLAVEGETGVEIEAGVTEIKGLGNGTYYLVETVAPQGYNLLTTPTEVVVADADNNATLNTDGTEYVSGGVQVINSTGALLPSTGGIGTTIFYAAGIVVMAGAVFFVVRSRKHD